MSRFKDLASGVLKMGYWTIPIFLLSCVCIVIGLAAFKSDYLTSYGGYMALGTRKAEGTFLGYGLADLIALAPQVIQLIFLYAIGSSDGEKKMTVGKLVFYILVWLFCFGFDTGTDVYYKAHGMALIYWIIAFFESVFINTIVSEFALVISLGLFLQLGPSALRMVFDLLIEIADVCAEAVKRVGTIIGNLLEAGKREVGGGDDPEIKINGLRR